jgi:HAMP domain-containing protein
MPLRAAEKALILARLERLHTLLDRLDKGSIDLVHRKHLRARMRRELNAAKKAVKTLATHDRS